MKVPFLDLSAHHEPLKETLEAAVRSVIRSGAFSGGPFVAEFENDFAAYCGSRFAVAVGSGTDALWLTLLALGVGSGDEVITVPNTFVATAEAIAHCGAKPVFVDVDEHTYTMDPVLMEKAITHRTKAIIPVHLFGHPADMDPIIDVAKQHGLPVVEDACQAHGAEYKGRKAGSIGVAGCFSFYPGKNLGAFGEAGAVVTDDPDLMHRIQMLRDHGRAQKHDHRLIGWNARMDGIQGAVLQVKLRHLDTWNEARRAHAQRYRELLNGHDDVILPVEPKYAKHVYHVYAVRIQKRDDVMRSLANQAINCAIHYPIPVHLQTAFRSLRHGPGSFPVAERCGGEFLSLPIFPELTEEQVGVVANEIIACTARTQKEPCAALA